MKTLLSSLFALFPEAGKSVLTILALALAFAAGWTVNDWRWAALEAARTLEAEQTRSAALEAARANEAVGEKLAEKLVALEAKNRKLGKEKDDAIRKLSTGRACLGADLVGLLNGSAAAGALDLPAPARGAPRAPAASAADPGLRKSWASDADVALWARYAREQYDLCRGRIDALRDFFNSAATQPNPSPSLPLSGEGGSNLPSLTREGPGVGSGEGGSNLPSLTREGSGVGSEEGVT